MENIITNKLKIISVTLNGRSLKHRSSVDFDFSTKGVPEGVTDTNEPNSVIFDIKRDKLTAKHQTRFIEGCFRF